MKKILLIAAFAFIGAFSANSQSLYESSAVKEYDDVEGEVVEHPADVLYESMEASLAKKGYHVGVFNEDGSVYVIASQTTMRTSSQTNFIQSRNNAYQIAEMKAKTSFMKLAGELIVSGRGYDILSEAGVAEESVSNLESDSKSYSESSLTKQEYYSKVLSMAAAMVQGCAVVRIAEGEVGNGNYEIAVCVKYCPEYQKFSELIKHGGVGAVPSGKAKDSMSTIQEMNTEDLVYRLGVWQTYDKNGKMIIFGFGQSEVGKNMAAYEIAKDKARLIAVDNIKHFVAEDLASAEMMESSEASAEYSSVNENDGNSDNSGFSSYFSSDKYEAHIKSAETSFNITTNTVRSWSAKHPANGKEIAGTIVVWTYENAAAGRELKKQFDRNRLDTADGTAPATKEAESTVVKKGRIVITGDDDDL